MNEDLLYLDDLAQLLTKRTEEGKIKWASGDRTGFVAEIGDKTIGVFIEQEAEPELVELAKMVRSGGIDVSRPHYFSMAVTDRNGRPLASGKSRQGEQNFWIFSDLWNSAAKSTRKADSSLRELFDHLENLT